MTANKGKAKGGLQQKHIHSRISYLFQAATYLAKIGSKAQNSGSNHAVDDQTTDKRCEDTIMSEEVPSRQSPYVVPPSQDDQDAGNTTAEAGSIPRIQDIGLSRQLFAHLRAVSLKSQIRLSPNIKHSICKRCDQLLVPGSSATRYVENKSRNGKKPWADVLVITCMACGASKRFPVGAKRQLRRGKRATQPKIETANVAASP